MLVFFLTMPVVSDTPWDPNGKTDGLFSYGLGVYACLMFTMQLKVMLLARVWTFWFDLAMLLSFFMFFLFCVVYGFFADVVSADFIYVPFVVFRYPRFWFLTVFVPIATIAIDLALEGQREGWYPSIAGEYRTWVVGNGLAGSWD